MLCQELTSRLDPALKGGVCAGDWIIATEVFPLLKAEPFIVIELQVESSNVARIVGSDGDDRTIYTKGLDYTDCPVGLWKFYLVDDVLLLPSEY